MQIFKKIQKKVDSTQNTLYVLQNVKCFLPFFSGAVALESIAVFERKPGAGRSVDKKIRNSRGRIYGRCEVADDLLSYGF